MFSVAALKLKATLKTFYSEIATVAQMNLEKKSYYATANHFLQLYIISDVTKTCKFFQLTIITPNFHITFKSMKMHH